MSETATADEKIAAQYREMRKRQANEREKNNENGITEESLESYSSYESEIENEANGMRKRKRRPVGAQGLDQDKFDLLLYNQQNKVARGNSDELGVHLNYIQDHETRNRQIEILKEQTDIRVEEFTAQMMERIEQVEKNLKKEMDVNDTDLQRQLMKQKVELGLESEQKL